MAIFPFVARWLAINCVALVSLAPIAPAVCLAQVATSAEAPDRHAVALAQQAGRQVERGEFAAARVASQEALELLSKQYGSTHWKSIDARQALADIDLVERLTADQRARRLAAFEQRREMLGHYVAGRNDEAAKIAGTVLETCAAVFGDNHVQTASSLNDLAMIYQAQRNFARALPLHGRALGPDHPETATSLNNVAEIYDLQGNYVLALPLYRRALSTREKLLEPDDPSLALSLNNLGVIYQTLGDYAPALALHHRALAIREKSLGPDDLATSQSINNLAAIYHADGDLAQARALYERALGIRRKMFGAEHPDVATSLNNLATVVAEMGERDRAIELHHDVLAMREKLLGPEHPDTASSCQNMAVLLTMQGKLDEALPWHERSIAIRLKTLGPDHHLLATSYSNLAGVYHRRGDLVRAVSLQRKSIEIMQRLVELTADAQSERQQLAMTDEARSYLNSYLTCVVDGRVDPAPAYAQVLAWKGAVLRRQRLARLARAAQNPELIATLEQLQVISANRARFALETPAPTQRDAWITLTAALRERSETLEAKLSNLSAAFRREHTQRAMTAEGVEQALPQDCMLLDFLEYAHASPPADGRGPMQFEHRFLVFVVRPAHPIALVDLGPASTIVGAVEAWRKTFGRGPAGPRLQQLIWEPLVAHLDGATTVIYSPDGALAQVPLAALPGAQPGSYLINDIGLAVVPVPQLLPEMLAEQASPHLPGSLLVVGDIDYDAQGGTQSARRAEPGTSPKARRQRIGQFAPLAAAEAELTSIRAWYERAAGGGPCDALMRGDATESALRQQAPRHAWLHLITHGFFAPPPGTATAPAANVPEIAGIGAGLQVRDDRCWVVQVLPGGATARDGRLNPGDAIAAIAEADGAWMPLAGKKLDDIVPHIRGAVGSELRLRVQPQGAVDGEVELKIERAAIALPTLPDTSAVDPGLLSGLALAGANAPPADNRDDGILTALEVSALDLSQVDSVVLSACETGLGRSAGGEGLLGLQRAFQMAGAKTVVATLWKVPDAATARLMERFYDNLWTRRMGKLAALREAQQFMLRSQATDPKATRGLVLDDQAPVDDGTLPPYYWAAFVLSGDWR